MGGHESIIYGVPLKSRDGGWKSVRGEITRAGQVWRFESQIISLGTSEAGTLGSRRVWGRTKYKGSVAGRSPPLAGPLVSAAPGPLAEAGSVGRGA